MKKVIGILPVLLLVSSNVFGSIGWGVSVKNTSSKAVYAVVDKSSVTKKSPILIEPGKGKFIKTLLGGERSVSWCYVPDRKPAGWTPEVTNWYTTKFYTKPDYLVIKDDGQYDMTEKTGLIVVGRDFGQWASMSKFISGDVLRTKPNIESALNQIIEELGGAKWFMGTDGKLYCRSSGGFTVRQE